MGDSCGDVIEIIEIGVWLVVGLRACVEGASCDVLMGGGVGLLGFRGVLGSS